jgi:hypothetical protein
MSGSSCDFAEQIMKCNSGWSAIILSGLKKMRLGAAYDGTSSLPRFKTNRHSGRGLRVRTKLIARWVWSMMLLGGIFAFSRLHLSKGPSSYIGTQGGVAFIMAMVTGNHPPSTTSLVIGRVAGITGGVLVVAVIGLVLGLRREKSRG